LGSTSKQSSSKSFSVASKPATDGWDDDDLKLDNVSWRNAHTTKRSQFLFLLSSSPHSNIAVHSGCSCE
jgi:hypothetical protein